MSKYKVVLEPDAQKDIDDIAKKHLRLVGVNSAKKIVEDIYDSLSLIGDTPFAGQIPKDRELAGFGYRVKVCGNYLCFYIVEDNKVDVHRIVDGRRDYKKLF